MQKLLLVCIAVSILTLFSGTIRADEFRNRLRDNAIASISKDAVSEPLPDGTWSDIDYQNKNRGSWATFEHLVRVGKLAVDPAQTAKTLKTLEAWRRLDPVNPNWWWSEIGVPARLCYIMLILDDRLPPGVLESWKPILARSKPGMTGQNKVWVAEIHLMKGVLYNDPKMVAEGVKQISSELCLAPSGKEGLQPDFSFHQHGTQLQTGNYGLSWFHSMVKWTTLFHGTPWQFSDEQVALLDHAFYDMIRYVMYKDFFDYSACGRQIDRDAPLRKYRAAFDSARRLMTALPDERKILYQKTLLKNHTLKLEGTRWFPDSAYLVHRPDDWFFSVKMCTSKIIGSETVNSENPCGKYQADGATFLMKNAREYYNILPAWDWRHLPGTTELVDASSLVARGIRNKSGEAAGLTDGLYAVSGLRFASKKELTADKVWFCFPDFVVCSGSDITTEKDFPVDTTIDQTRLVGKVQLRKGKRLKTVEEGIHSLTHIDAVLHNGTEYILDSKEKYTLEIGPKKGNVRTVNASQTDKEVTEPIFLLTVNHGQKARNASYRYTLLPRPEKVEKSSVAEQLKTSSPRIHAVYSPADNVVMIAAFVSGTVTLPNSQQRTIDKPSLILIKDGKEKKKVFSERLQEEKKN